MSGSVTVVEHESEERVVVLERERGTVVLLGTAGSEEAVAAAVAVHDVLLSHSPRDKVDVVVDVGHAEVRTVLDVVVELP